MYTRGRANKHNKNAKVVTNYYLIIYTMMIELLKHPVFTEKSVRLIADNQYTFDVDLKLTKPEIKKVIKEIFKVDVLSVNTHRPPRKKRRLGITTGFKSSKKRVIIRLKGGQSLPLLTDPETRD